MDQGTFRIIQIFLERDLKLKMIPFPNPLYKETSLYNLICKVEAKLSKILAHRSSAIFSMV